MNIIVAVDNDWGIGKNGELLVRISDDLKRFRNLTIGKTVIYGTKTLATFPRGEALGMRNNIVLNPSEEFSVPGAKVVHSVKEALEEAGKYPTDDVYVIGGASVYLQLLPYCNRAFVTKIDRVFGADAYIPNLDTMSDWRMVFCSDRQTGADGLSYYFTEYQKRV